MNDKAALFRAETRTPPSLCTYVFPPLWLMAIVFFTALQDLFA